MNTSLNYRSALVTLALLLPHLSGLASEAPTKWILHIRLPGTGIPPAELQLKPNSLLDFGSLVLTHSKGLEAELENPTYEKKLISPLTLEGDAAFEVTGSTCPDVLPALSKCSVAVSYVPTEEGSDSGVLRFGKDSGITATLTGSAKNLLSLDATELPVGTVTEVYSSVDLASLLHRIDGVPIPRESIQWTVTSGQLPKGLQIYNGYLSGVPSTIGYSYAQPFTLNARFGNYSVYQSYSVAISDPARLKLNPSGSLSFGNVVTFRDIERTVQVQNLGGEPLALTVPAIEPAMTAFSVKRTDCPVPLPAGRSCTVTVGITAPTEADLSAKLRVTADANGSLDLLATGFNPVVLAKSAISRATVGEAFALKDFYADFSLKGEAKPAADKLAWTIETGKLLAGLTFEKGVISGTPSALTRNTRMNFKVGVEFEKNKAQIDQTILVQGLLTGISKVAIGDSHSCAIANGAAYCFGSDSKGALGDGKSTYSLYPVPVVGMESGVTDIAVGSGFSCAIKSSSLYCWGVSSAGVGTSSSTTPVLVTGLPAVREVDAGTWNVCAVTTTNALYCMGSGTQGVIGDGTYNHSLTPKLVSTLGSTVSTISQKGSNICALTTSGAVWCWGYNWYQSTGHSSTANSTIVPYRVIASGASLVATGYANSCAVVSGRVHCWGENSMGVVSIKASSSTTPTPTLIASLPAGPYASLEVASNTACALLSTGTTYCWGYADNFFITDFPKGSKSTPKALGLLPSATRFFMSDNTACALIGDGSSKCWGRVVSGLGGNGKAPYDTPISYILDVDVTKNPPPN